MRCLSPDPVSCYLHGVLSVGAVLESLGALVISWSIVFCQFAFALYCICRLVLCLLRGTMFIISFCAHLSFDALSEPLRAAFVTGRQLQTGRLGSCD